jgi:hypothetical protein
MCRSYVAPEAEGALADLLLDMAHALDPEHAERVVIGPVDFGANPSTEPRAHRAGVFVTFSSYEELPL